MPAIIANAAQLDQQRFFSYTLPMTTAVLVKKVKSYTATGFGKEPMIVLPLLVWEEIQEHLEDLEILASKNLAKDVEKSRQEIKKGKTVSLRDL